MTIIERMQSDMDFTDTEKNIIHYILENPYSLMDITIGELAKNTYSSNATIVRFCKKMGFQGISDFRHAFLMELESSKYTVNSVDYSMPFGTKESTSTVLNRMYSLYKESIDLIQSRIEPQQMKLIVECLIRAERIFIMGHGDTKISIKGFINKMIKINRFPILASDNNEEIRMFPYMTQKDCAFFLVESGRLCYT